MTQIELEEYRKQIDEIDKIIAQSFEKRMEIVSEIAEYKKILGLPTCDPIREQKMFEKNSKFIQNENLKSYYKELLQKYIDLSKSYQQQLKK